MIRTYFGLHMSRIIMNCHEFVHEFYIENMVLAEMGRKIWRIGEKCVILR